MASVASQLIEEVTAHEQSDSLEFAREICADGTYFPNNLRILLQYQCNVQIMLLVNYTKINLYIVLLAFLLRS